MLKITPQSLFRFDLLQDFSPLDDDAPPATWSGNWVSRRLIEGFKTLRLIPFKGKPTGFKNAWPPYMVEWEDLVARQEQGELEVTQREQNRVRLQPSLRDVTRAEAVVCWPLYLKDREPLLLAVNRVGWAFALDRDATFVAARHGGMSETWLGRYLRGCGAIADGLRRDHVPVF
jgi:hypothetical protein